jgi:hypothetical protein
MRALKLVFASALLLAADIASASVPALDVTDATTYLETNAGGGIAEIGVVMLTLAGLAVAIKWVKATFFG